MADRLLVTAEGGPFHVEYALFDAGEIALGRNALGRPFEQGYATTAGDARHRLAQLGATPQLADTCADVMQPTLVQAYARGSMVRKVATMLDTQLLFESGRYQGGADLVAGVYHGTFLDLASLALDLGYPSIGALLHALYLAVVLAGAPADAPLELDTHELTLSLKPGERTHRRVTLEGLLELPSLLQDLANRGGGRGARGRELPRDALLALLDERAMPGADTGAYRTALDTRELPTRGPLARADLWEIELLLDAGDRGAAHERIERVERTAGRSPATAYLRARQELLAGGEDPAVLAARVSALALSMTSFVELGLLAGEAWMIAGDTRRAHAHAQDVIATKGIDATLRERANAVLHGAVRGPAPPSQPRAVKAAPVTPLSGPTEEVATPFFPDPRAEPGRPQPRLENLAAAPRRPSHSGLVRVPAP
ncbi:MAG TPA: hypothetical protein PLR99_19090, partial [Polyangiaceae bacterium]|nr:hypothetical protein [Polyangiaceae bacterium]